ncbi:hypothetical protein ACLQ22_31960, partial [Micromonospora sp. DT178]|uniref:hypothetical protein n=1 Tax=Micromonospora sp. DT178 TaxID=3393436 RepID=UPI003CF65105
GLVRSAQSEHPNRFILLDLDDDTDHGNELGRTLTAVLDSGEPEITVRAGELGRILTAVLDSGEPEIAVRAGELYIRRLTRAGDIGRLLLPGPDRLPWRIDVSEPGSLDNLTVRDCPEAMAPLAAG